MLQVAILTNGPLQQRLNCAQQQHETLCKQASTKALATTSGNDNQAYSTGDNINSINNDDNIAWDNSSSGNNGGGTTAQMTRTRMRTTAFTLSTACYDKAASGDGNKCTDNNKRQRPNMTA